MLKIGGVTTVIFHFKFSGQVTLRSLPFFGIISFNHHVVDIHNKYSDLIMLFFSNIKCGLNYSDGDQRLS